MRLPARRGRDAAGAKTEPTAGAKYRKAAPNARLSAERGFSAAGRTKSTFFKSTAVRISAGCLSAARGRIVRAHTKRSIKPDAGEGRIVRAHTRCFLVSTPHSARCLEKMQRDGCRCRPSKNVLVSPFPPAPLLKRAFASPPAVGYNGYNIELSLQRENCTLTIFVKHSLRGKPDAAPLRFADDVSRAACGSARYDAVFTPLYVHISADTHHLRSEHH